MKADHPSYGFISLDTQIAVMAKLLDKLHTDYSMFTCLAILRCARDVLTAQGIYGSGKATASYAMEDHYNEFVASVGTPEWWSDPHMYYRERRSMLRRFSRYPQGQKLLEDGHVQVS